jgi:DNA-binding LacI/PurR family transcriptional regulator
MGPTLQTVADAVGVSRSTVSNAYNRPDQLSPELRERILQAAQRLGYCGPDPAARSLRKGRVGAIGVLLSVELSYAFTDPYAVQFLRGMAETAERHRTGLLLLPLSADDDEAAARTVRDAVVDGFCTYCVPDWHRSLAAVRARGLPIVSAERLENAGPDAFVGIDEAGATRTAGRHLTALGHRRIAVISDWIVPDRVNRPVNIRNPESLQSYVDRERLVGYRDAFAEAGIDWQQVATVNAGRNCREEGEKAAAHVLDRAPRPTAIVAITDQLALGVLDALRTRGLQPGRDVSVMGFDDIPEAAEVGLTTVRQPSLEKGRIAAGLLLDPPAQPELRHVLLPTELRVRASTGPSLH